MLTLKQKLEKLRQLIKEIKTLNENSEGIKLAVAAYLQAMLDDLAE